jgi:hypothetical protein
MRASVSATREPDEARVPPEQRTGLSECRQSGEAFDHGFIFEHALLSKKLPRPLHKAGGVFQSRCT